MSLKNGENGCLKKKKKRRKHIYWIRDVFKNKESSEYYTLFETLRLKEREYHYK